MVSKNWMCYLCKTKDFLVRPGKVRDAEEIKVLECINCGLVALSSMDHIKEDHYEESGMHEESEIDIESWIKSSHPDDARRLDFLSNEISNKNILDFGCGNGNFLQLARASAKTVAGIELEKNMHPWFKKNNLKVFRNIQDAKSTKQEWDLITAFHVVEHLAEPMSILGDLSEMLTTDGKLVIEVPNSNDALLTLYNNPDFQDFSYWSQHLYLYNQATLRELIGQTGLQVHWIKQVQRYPLSNHLHWLAEGQPGGHEKWSFLNNKQLNSAYERELASLGIADTIIAVASKKRGK
jgi:2-polyprenyl-3-methyl-5-hydroxy-6-metoxy-1,4-benzoquinol methylase